MRIVFFDGECNLCHGLVDFLVRRDSRRVLRFASLQGQTARRELGAATVSFDTLIYLREGHRFVRSDAVLAILYDLGGVWTGAAALRILPRGLRDAIYGVVARNRFRWFGRRQSCRVPTADERAIFLE